MSQKQKSSKGISLITDEFTKQYIRTIVITKGNAEIISNHLKKSRSSFLKSLAESIDDQINSQGGY